LTRKPSKKSTKSKKRKKKKTSLKKRLFKIAILALFAGILSLFILFGAVYVGLFGPLPDKQDLVEIDQANAAEIYSSDGALLGKYFIQNRSSVSFDEIPSVVVDALIATEDSRFFEHEGIDFYSIPRVVIKTIILGDKSGGGGSTISQQLVKNLFGRKNHGALSLPVNKLKENITALKLEEIYSKEEIITLYLNTVSFGENVYGIKAATRRFFDKSPSELTVVEAATLVGMLKANTSYNPRLYPEASLERRNIVLALMVREGSLLPEDMHRLQSQPMEIRYRRLEGQYGPAPYLRAHLEEELKSLLANTDRGDGKPYNLYTDGLTIELTLNSELQAAAESAVRKKMKSLQKVFDEHWQGKKPWGKDHSFLWREAKKSIRYKRLKESGRSDEEIQKVFATETKIPIYTLSGYEVKSMTPLDSIAYHQMILQAGFLAMDNQSGDVLAYVGGIDFGHFPYDHVQSKRQVGSTFKPFVYTTALEQGIQPCDFIKNERIIFSNYDDWSPENAGEGYGGFYTVKGGLAKSVNTIAARLIAETGPQSVRATARRMGIESELPEGPSLALGVADLSLSEMVPSYAAFANGGIRVRPQFVKTIKTSQGEEIFSRQSQEKERVLDRDIAENMRRMLELVVDSGTARSLRSVYGIRSDLGGKTGTTQNNADGWFISITPNLVCGAWVGAESPLVRFRSTRLGQGAATALPIIAEFLRSSERNRSTAKSIGLRFPPTGADTRLDLYCPIYVDNRTDHFFDRLFNDEIRRERRRLRAEAKEEDGKDRDGGKDKEKKGWIGRLFDKLKKK